MTGFVPELERFPRLLLQPRRLASPYKHFILCLSMVCDICRKEKRAAGTFGGDRLERGSRLFRTIACRPRRGTLPRSGAVPCVAAGLAVSCGRRAGGYLVRFCAHYTVGLIRNNGTNRFPLRDTRSNRPLQPTSGGRATVWAGSVRRRSRLSGRALGCLMEITDAWGYAVESNPRVLLLKQCHRPAPGSRPRPQRLWLKSRGHSFRGM
jgi:hypothetical protein